MIPKNERVYIKDWFTTPIDFNETGLIKFSTTTHLPINNYAVVHIDSDGDAYIDRSEDMSSDDGSLDSYEWIQFPTDRDFEKYNMVNDMIHKNNRVYIKDWFDIPVNFEAGDTIEFEMPQFCSGDYIAEIYIDSEGDAYIDKSNDYYKGCRDFDLVKKNH